MNTDDIGDFASWAHAEAVYAGADVARHLPRPADECSPFEVLGACMDALDEQADLACYVALAGMTGMMLIKNRKGARLDRDEFVAICVQEGLELGAARAIWEARHADGVGDLLNERDVRRAARETAAQLRVNRMVENYLNGGNV